MYHSAHFQRLYILSGDILFLMVKLMLLWHNNPALLLSVKENIWISYYRNTSIIPQGPGYLTQLIAKTIWRNIFDIYIAAVVRLTHDTTKA